MFTRRKTSIVGIAILATALISPQVAHALSFAGQPFVQYGDAQSYSLAVSQLLTNCTNPGCPYYIPSGGQIADLVVVATGSNGNPVTTNFPGMDNAYATPNGTGAPNYFQTGGLTFGGNTYPAADPGGVGQFSGDAANTWDTTLGALKGFLGGSNLVFFFNNNQTNSGSAADQNLAAWMQITIRDAGGNIIGTYDFTNDNSPYAGVFDVPAGGGHLLGDVANYTSTGAAPTGAPGGSPTDYVLSGGLLCLNAGSPVSCSQPHDQEINNNLGRDQASYALIFPELNAQLAALFASGADLSSYSMNLDVRLGCDPTLFGTDPASAACVSKSLNNGYEQLFFGPLETLSIPTPEPTSLLLFGVGLAGLIGWRRRKDQ